MGEEKLPVNAALWRRREFISELLPTLGCVCVHVCVCDCVCVCASVYARACTYNHNMLNYFSGILAGGRREEVRKEAWRHGAGGRGREGEGG